MTKKYYFSDDLISDLYKDAFGHRPRQSFFLRWEKSSNDEKEAIWNDLIDDMVKNNEEEARLKAESASILAKRIKETCKLGAKNYRTAIKWILQADELEEDQLYGGEYLAYQFNLDYKHQKLFKLAGVA